MIVRKLASARRGVNRTVEVRGSIPLSSTKSLIMPARIVSLALLGAESLGSATNRAQMAGERGGELHRAAGSGRRVGDADSLSDCHSVHVRLRARQPDPRRPMTLAVV
jgi:hypothetical protein